MQLTERNILRTIFRSVIRGDAEVVARGVEQAVESGHTPQEILDKGMVAAMAEVGRRFETQECFIPEMLIAARAMKAGMTILKPHLIESHIEPIGKVILGTVQGDLHDIGKNLAAMMLEGAGLSVVDLGKDVTPQQFVEGVRDHAPQVVGMSALLTTTMPKMQKTIEALTEAALRDEVVIVIGGAPVTRGFADEIGADLYAPDASSAATLIRRALLQR